MSKSNIIRNYIIKAKYITTIAKDSPQMIGVYTHTHTHKHSLNKMQSKLAGWKSKMLSVGGRLILIKHVLAAIPLHSYVVLEPSKSVMHQIERLMSHFF